MYAQKEENKMNGLDFIRAVKALAKERGISEDEIFDYMETALHAAFKKNNNATNSKVKIDRSSCIQGSC